MDGRGHVTAMGDATAVFARNVRDAIGQADDAGDQGTADIFTEVSRGADKMLWFLEAHTQTAR
jgi:starvation-inducible DNA-binding protein